nr:DUF6538 domain-containing protein [Methylobacterium sp. L1A1]
MATPWLHPKSGTYYYRRRVPKDLVELVGHGLEKFSLRTTDRVEARRRFELAERQVEERWANLRKGYRRLSWHEIAAIGGDFYRLYVEKYRKWFSPHYTWSLMTDCHKVMEGTTKKHQRDTFDHDVGAEIDKYLEERGLLVDRETRRSIEYHVAKAVVQASDLPYRWWNGDFCEDPHADRFPQTPAPTIPVRALESFSAYAGAAELAAATCRRWRPVFENLVQFAEEDDLSKINADKLVAWLDHLLASERKAITVRDVYLAAVKAVYGWLVSRRRLKANPTKELTVKVPFAERRDMREFTDREACSILSATLRPQSAKLAPHFAAARRWVPWICAYTGARVNEITQLRRSDIQFENGIWTALVTPEAGSVKNRKQRRVPLHPHLISQGLVQFVLANATETLFYVPDPAGDPARNNARIRRSGERLAKWVRDLGVYNTDVGPSHGWRHRFKTEGRRVGMVEAVLEAVQGHAPRSQGENYGSFPPDVMLLELLKLVPYRVNGVDVSVAGAQTYEYDYGSPEAAQAVAKLLDERKAAAGEHLLSEARRSLDPAASAWEANFVRPMVGAHVADDECRAGPTF